MRYVGDASVTECALNVVRVQRDQMEPVEVVAVARINDWAVTPYLGKPGRFAVTHVPTGLKTGPALTERDAMRTCAKLRDIRVATAQDLALHAPAIIAAHPVTWRRRIEGRRPVASFTVLPEAP